MTSSRDEGPVALPRAAVAPSRTVTVRRTGPLAIAWAMTKGCYFALFTAVYDGLHTSTLMESDRQNRPGVTSRAIGVAAFFQLTFVLYAILFWTMATGTRVALPKGLGLPVFLALAAFNYWATVRTAQWDIYLNAIRAIPRRQRVVVTWTARLAALAMLASVFYFPFFAEKVMTR